MHPAARAAFLLVVLLAASPLALAQTAPAGSEVDVTGVDGPAVIVAGEPFSLRVHVQNKMDEAADPLYLFTALYAWEEGNPCGAASESRFRGFVHRVQPAMRVPPRQATTYPTAGQEWHHVANASQVGSGGTLELCVFAASTETPGASMLTYYDYWNFTVAARPANGAPVADFDFAPRSPRATDAVRFTARAEDPEGDALTYAWDFGRFDAKGRAVASGPEADHAFYPEGTYTVTLTVSDGWDSTVVAKEVTVLPEAASPPLTDATTQDGGGFLGVPAPAVALAAVAAAAAAAVARRRRD